MSDNVMTQRFNEVVELSTPEKFIRLSTDHGFRRSISVTPADLITCKDINIEVELRSGKKDNLIFAVIESAFNTNAYAHMPILKAIVRNKNFDVNMKNSEGLGVIDVMALYNPAKSAKDDIELENNKTFKQDATELFAKAGAIRQSKVEASTLSEAANVVFVHSNYEMAIVAATKGKELSRKPLFGMVADI